MDDSDRKPMFPWMVGAEAAQAPKAAPKRRQTMAEMLRSSQLIGGTVALHEAVEAAQEAAARKAEATELPQRAADTAPPPDVINPAPAVMDAPTAAPIPTPARQPRAGGNRYNLYAKINGIWVWQFAVDAATHGEGLGMAVARLTPALSAAPIRMEQDETPAA